MKLKEQIWCNAFAFILLIAFLGGCREDEWQGEDRIEDFIVQMEIPDVKQEDIQTRILNINKENAIHNVLAVIIAQDGLLRSEDCIGQQITQAVGTGQATLTLRNIRPLDGEKLYLFCNTSLTKSDLQGKNVTSEDTLLKTITIDNSLNYIPLYGMTIVGGNESLPVKLKRAYVKTSVKLNDEIIGSPYRITDWGVYNIPSASYLAEAEVASYPEKTIFTETMDMSEEDSCAYFVERRDNASVDLSKKTCVCVQLNGSSLGWYRLDFYKEGKFLPLKRNTNYALTIISVKSNGYATLEEAMANPGSNIEYTFEVSEDWSHVYSNGQYLLKINKDKIEYTTSQVNVDIPDILTVQAIFSTEGSYHIETYTAEVINGDGKAQLVYGNQSNVKVNLLAAGVIDESKGLGMKISGTLPVDCCLELKLGNIVKRVPLQIVTANCYIVNFNTAGTTTHIPVIQGNRDGVIRIKEDDVVEASLLWSDVPNPPLAVSYDNGEKSIIITNSGPFVGNVVIAAKVDSKIRWSWHLWALPENDIIQSNQSSGWDIKKTYKQGGETWMDRNLGALTTEHKLSARGLLYQWGRKDPFPPSEDWNIPNNVASAASIPIYNEGSAVISAIQQKEVNSFPNNLEYSILHPMVNLKGLGTEPSNQQFDWYVYAEGVHNNYLWNSVKGDKTPYDPCPIGWRVPRLKSYVGPLAGLSTESVTFFNEGIETTIEGENIYFPTSVPFIGGTTGVYTTPSYDHYNEIKSSFWYATRSDFYEDSPIYKVLYFEAGTSLMALNWSGTCLVKPLSTEMKCWSLSVRCVRE